MNQNIGISFSVTGHDNVITQLQNLETAMGNFASKAALVSGGVKQFVTSIEGFGKSLSAFKGELSGLGVAAKAFGDNMKNAAKSTKELGVAGQRIVPTGSGVRSHRGTSMMDLTAPGFMLRYQAYSGMMRGGKSLVEDIWLGGSREKMVEGLRDISAIGFDKRQRQTTEDMGQQYLRNVWSTGKIEDYLNAVAEAGSAWNVNDERFRGNGAEIINQMAQQAMVLGGVSKMKAEASSRMLQSLVHSQIAFMPASERASYESGEKNLADLSEETAGKVGKIIADAQMWGADANYMMQYFLPTALQKGMKLDTILSLVGTLRNTGLTGSKLSRGLREIFEGESGHFAAVEIAADPRLWAMYRAQTATEQKGVREAMGPIHAQLMAQSPKEYFARLGQQLDAAEARGIDLVQTLGLPKSWVGLIRTLSRQAVVGDWGKQEQVLAGIHNLDLARAQLMSGQMDPGWHKTRLANAWQAYTSALSRGDVAGRTIETLIDFLTTRRENLLSKNIAEGAGDFGPIGKPGPWAEVMQDFRSFIDWDNKIAEALKLDFGFDISQFGLSAAQNAGKYCRELFEQVTQLEQVLLELRTAVGDALTGFVQKAQGIVEWIKNPNPDVIGEKGVVDPLAGLMPSNAVPDTEMYVNAASNLPAYEAPPAPEAPAVQNLVEVYIDGEKIAARVRDKLSRDTTMLGGGYGTAF